MRRKAGLGRAPLLRGDVQIRIGGAPLRVGALNNEKEITYPQLAASGLYCQFDDHYMQRRVHKGPHHCHTAFACVSLSFPQEV